MALGCEDSLTRLPHRYDTAVLEDLRLKSSILTIPLIMVELGDPKLSKHLADFARNGQALLGFGWRALTAA